MSFLPDSKWLDALSLPTRVITGLAVGAWGILLAGHYQWIQLEPFWRGVAICVAILFSAIAISSIAGQEIITFRGWLASRKAKREDADKKKADNERVERAHRREQETILARLDSLSGEELRYVAEALQKKTPSIFTYVHSPAMSLLLEKGLATSPGGTHNQDHYPFRFHDFVWEAIQAGGADFIEREARFRQQQELKRQGKLGRP
ncbi:hypothetical protein [Mesorhizobium sp.]|uniref:hypothetical protein n=1 Tax=Mesorhizobium sp. TaxID=1871066 RepID=UPI000FE42C46|nr:hypothetical protein [Mesorhizobium sp.]RWN55575.1 MAG: hypothetical protein EOR98_12275 [Mesorhizobium sp.]RWN77275.1 MAG: hypothetical protein EOS02_12220 [Mesorhizobium sp.]RWN80186.1 MAG: hypothetical protein EOS01_12340 [Mesorhizobium sp.]RWN86099.1 MAG: hypothetical protein EOS04_19605 [Mesorhizobium sp.]RWO15011.1 MAG: hypothetical protein EOS15_11995 [Mesorhizobium sp.]